VVKGPPNAFWLLQANSSFVASETNDTDQSVFLISSSSLQDATAIAPRTIMKDREHIDSGALIAECPVLKFPLSVPAVFAEKVRASLHFVVALGVRLRFFFSPGVHISRLKLASLPTVFLDRPFVLQAVPSQATFSLRWAGEHNLPSW